MGFTTSQSGFGEQVGPDVGTDHLIATITVDATRKGLRTYTLTGHVYPGVAGETVRLYSARGLGYSGLKSVHLTKTAYVR